MYVNAFLYTYQPINESLKNGAKTRNVGFGTGVNVMAPWLWLEHFDSIVYGRVPGMNKANLKLSFTAHIS